MLYRGWGWGTLSSHNHRRSSAPCIYKQKRTPHFRFSSNDVNAHTPLPRTDTFKSRRALLIGINYTGMDGELKGCRKDVERMTAFLHDRGFSEGDIVTLDEFSDVETFSSDPLTRVAKPTRKNILEAMKWLASPGENSLLFFHYSGHGVRVKDLDGDEDDGFDEAIVPVDYQTSGVIIDDLIKKVLVDSIPNGCVMMALMDCCHSGSIMDLPYTFKASELRFDGSRMSSKKNLKMKEEREKGNLLAEDKGLIWDLIASKPAATTAEPGQVVLLSGCLDQQKSADVSSLCNFSLPPALEVEGGGGVHTGAFLSIASETTEGISYVVLLEHMRKYVQEAGFAQIPQLSSSKVIDLHDEFLILPHKDEDESMANQENMFMY